MPGHGAAHLAVQAFAPVVAGQHDAAHRRSTVRTLRRQLGQGAHKPGQTLHGKIFRGHGHDDVGRRAENLPGQRAQMRRTVAEHGVVSGKRIQGPGQQIVRGVAPRQFRFHGGQFRRRGQHGQPILRHEAVLRRRLAAEHGGQPLAVRRFESQRRGQMRLGIGIHDQDAPAKPTQSGSQIHGAGRLAHAALVIAAGHAQRAGCFGVHPCIMPVACYGLKTALRQPAHSRPHLPSSYRHASVRRADTAAG